MSGKLIFDDEIYFSQINDESKLDSIITAIEKSPYWELDSSENRPETYFRLKREVRATFDEIIPSLIRFIRLFEKCGYVCGVIIVYKYYGGYYETGCIRIIANDDDLHSITVCSMSHDEVKTRHLL